MFLPFNSSICVPFDIGVVSSFPSIIPTANDNSNVASLANNSSSSANPASPTHMVSTSKAESSYPNIPDVAPNSIRYIPRESTLVLVNPLVSDTSIDTQYNSTQLNNSTQLSILSLTDRQCIG